MSQKNKKYNLYGFTLLELLTATIIFSLAIAAATTTYVMLNQAWKEDLALKDMARDANLAIEKMIRGMAMNTGLAAAKSIELPAVGASGNDLRYTDMNDVSRRFYYSGGNIYTESVSLMLSNVESVTFSNVNHILRIALTLREHVANRDMRFSMETQTTIRN